MTKVVIPRQLPHLTVLSMNLMRRTDVQLRTSLSMEMSNSSIGSTLILGVEMKKAHSSEDEQAGGQVEKQPRWQMLSAGSRTEPQSYILLQGQD